MSRSMRICWVAVCAVFLLGIGRALAEDFTPSCARRRSPQAVSSSSMRMSATFE